MSEAALAKAPELPQDSEAIPGGGRLAAAAHLELVDPEAYTTTLSSDETAVLSLISEGNTASQVARQLEIDKDEVLDHRNSAKDKYGTASTTSAVNQAIREGSIPIEVEPDDEVISGLSSLDRRMLGLYAKGLSNHWFARQYDVSIRSVERYHDGLLKRVGAWNRPQAIRRMYELGIWKVEDPSAGSSAPARLASVPGSAEPAEAHQTPQAS